MREFSRRRLVAFAVAASLGAVVSCADVSPDHEAGRHALVTTAAAKIKHVFLIVLENKNYTDTFATSTQDPYLQKTLVPMGALLTQYYGTGHVSLDNYISMISGQSPTQDTANDCMPGFTSTIGNYNDVVQTGITPEGQVIAQQGCIYSKLVKTLPEQLSAAGLTWRAYMEDMGNDPARESDTCGHPVIGLGTDNTNRAEAPSAAVPLGDAYATRHNPFVYFHSIIDSPSCHTHVVNLSKLAADLEKESSTPNFVFITPNLCNDAHDGSGTGAAGSTCVNGEPGGLTSADAFLKEWVPRIMASRAYREDGLLIITFDESNYTQSVGRNPSSGQSTVTITFPGESCCNQQPGPNLSGFRPGSFTLVDTPALVTKIAIDGFGGGRIGALLLSPFINPGSTSEIAYNHYSLLRSLEDIFRLEEHLGYAADDVRIHYSLSTIGNDRNIFQQRF